jgi:hypothetical protein
MSSHIESPSRAHRVERRILDLLRLRQDSGGATVVRRARRPDMLRPHPEEGPTMAKAKTKKPNLQRARQRIVVYLSPSEANQLHLAAAEEGASDSGYGRRVLLLHLRNCLDARNRSADRSPALQSL